MNRSRRWLLATWGLSIVVGVIALCTRTAGDSDSTIAPSQVAIHAAQVVDVQSRRLAPLPAARHSNRNGAHSRPAQEPVATLQSFESSRDIWSLAQSALHSNSSSRTFEAYVGARECVGIASQWNDYATFAGGGSTIPMNGSLTPERQLAIQELGYRCSGFLRVGLRASIALMRALRQHGDGLDGPRIFTLASDTADAVQIEQIRDLLLSESPAAIESGLPRVVSLWAVHMGISDPNDKRRELMGIASVLAACELGKDCSASGYSTQLSCAAAGICNSALWSDWRSGLSVQDIDGVEDYKSRLVSAIKTRNLAAIAPN